MIGSIVELYKGTIDCDSSPGKGTTFTITLPLDLTPRKPILRRVITGIGRSTTGTFRRISRALGHGETA